MGIPKYPWVWASVAVGAAGLALRALAPELDAARALVSVFALVVAATQLRGMVADIRAGSWGIDVLAVVAIGASVAVGEHWAALVVCLMLSGGEALEDFAGSRAQAELTGVLERAPAHAHVVAGAGTRTVVVDRVRVGDVLHIRPGEIVPVDGVLLSDVGEFDESSLTGEPLPVVRRRGADVMSGAINGVRAVRVRASARAADSRYQQIVALVEHAASSRSPMVRLADRVAVPFTVVALAVAGIGWWVSGDPLRAAQVLVVATPCPLLIAAPVAFLAGMSRAARAGIIVKDGATIERLSRIRAAAFDKTGTLTRGAPRVVAVHPAPGLDAPEVLSVAAAVESSSAHPLARAIVAAARQQHVRIAGVADAREVVGSGFVGTVEGRRVAVGNRAFIADRAPAGAREGVRPGVSVVDVAVDDRYAGSLWLADEIRPEAPATIAALRSSGVGTVVMLTGDLPGSAAHVARRVGIDDVRAQLTPGGKVAAIAEHRPVMMVGDGVNDAPVLAAADVGVAMGLAGSAAAADSADVVVMADDLHRVALAVSIGKRTTAIAMQAIGLGVGLSVALMAVALTGAMPAIVGAGMQEFVDLACIAWALRALRADRATAAARERGHHPCRPGRREARVLGAAGA